MKVIKPMKLGLLTRCFEFKQRFRMGVSVLMHVPLGEQPDLYSEVSMWKFVTGELGAEAALDAAIPKLLPEFLVSARAYPPGQKPAAACAVRAKFGSREKTVLAFGDRWWDGANATAPQPYSEMPLDWSRAFGGEGYPANPLGKGVAKITLDDGRTVTPLANLEHPDERVLRPQDRPAPVGFGPIDQTWPQRAERVGTYDAAWLKTDFPGFARDTNWRFFNIAPADQWLEFPLAADERYEFENLHPEKSRIEGKLPGFQARCFVNRKTGQDLELEAVPMRLGTVWFFPHAERCVLVYQGFVDIAEEDGADIRHLMIAAEHDTQRKAHEHYATVIAQRLDKENGFLYALRDSDLLPEGIVPLDPQLEAEKRTFEGEDLLRKNLRRRQEREVMRVRAEVAALGMDPDEHAPPLPPPEPPLPDLEHLPEFIAAAEAQAERQREDALASAKAQEEATRQQFEALGMDYVPIKKEYTDRPVGPPLFSAQSHIDSLRVLAEEAGDDPVTIAELEGYYKDPEWVARLFESERKAHEAYRLSAHMQGRAPAMEADRAQALRAAIPRVRSGELSLARLDLTGADLSGLDLQGLDFSGSFLESADFSGSQLAGANFTEAVLSRARFHGSQASQASFVRANLGEIDCDGATFDDGDFSEAILHGACLRRSSFKRATLTGAECMDVQFEDTDWSEISTGTSMLFFERDLRGLRLAGAQLGQASFLRCDVSGTDFHGALLEGAVFLAAKGAGANFSGARLGNLRCVEDCDFSQADFTDAQLAGANLRGCKLAGSLFMRAVLDGADLSEADLTGASLYLASAIEARLVKAKLTDAILVSTNLMNAIVQRSDILGADFRLANLFQADFARVRVDHSVRFDHALMTRLRTEPRLSRPTSS